MSSTETSAPVTIPEVAEKDKPFYLAILSMIALLVGIIASLYIEGNHPDVYKGLWQQVALVFTPFVMMSWTFYFKDHSG